MRRSVWCRENVLGLAVMSGLKRYGYFPILGDPPTLLLTFSKQDLVDGGAKLQTNYMQGKNYVDISLRNDELVLGVVASRMLALARKRNDEGLTLVLRMLFDEPNKAVEAYKKLKDLGFDFSATNVAKMYKTYIVSRSISKLRRAREVCKRIILLSITPCISIECQRNALEDSMNRLIEFVMQVHKEKLELVYSCYCFKPSELCSSSPSFVVLKRISGETIVKDVIEIPFMESMGKDYLGCKKCEYLNLCSEMFSR